MVKMKTLIIFACRFQFHKLFVGFVAGTSPRLLFDREQNLVDFWGVVFVASPKQSYRA